MRFHREHITVGITRWKPAPTPSSISNDVSLLASRYCQPLQETPAVMFNLLGLDGWQGNTVVEADDSLERASDVFIHTYENNLYSGTKMGHVTVTSDSVESAIVRATAVREQVHIRGSNPL